MPNRCQVGTFKFRMAHHRRVSLGLRPMNVVIQLSNSPCSLQVLVQECIRYNKLIAVMQRSLPELQKALKGLVVMSGELEAVGKAIALNTVPEEWEAKVRLPVFFR